ncbi:bnr asp-box repeat family protein [Stylonychia lemnae]|uniref:Bnr asp-box repeat family protein n=1 Tax=Stylonychia lemnae TaxID=5949 RepID=A0A078AMT8_STYLE|nr:bnr asp-box repeat family protein [Stylonychia lemnae]|eukprot:CDW83469.1 bnr asp-box repeat family protein [Stylonychia lemnae]
MTFISKFEKPIHQIQLEKIVKIHKNSDGSILLLELSDHKIQQQQMQTDLIGLLNILNNTTNASPSKYVLAHKYQDEICYKDPTEGDCRQNLYISHEIQKFEWWMLAKFVTKYDFFKEQKDVGVLVISKSGIQKSQQLNYYYNLDGKFKSQRLTNFVEDYQIVNEQFIYVIKSQMNQQKLFVVKYDIDNIFGNPVSVRFNKHGAFSKNLNYKFISNSVGANKNSQFTCVVSTKYGDQGLKNTVSSKKFLYQSDHRGAEFSLLLDDINMIEDKIVDLSKLESMDFVMIANTHKSQAAIENNEADTLDLEDDTLVSVDLDEDEVEMFKTTISYNNGAQWHKISNIFENKAIHYRCQDNDCNVNLILHKHPSTLNIPQVKSHFHSNGVIMANGFFGGFDFENVKTLVSSDGGLSWTIISNQPSHFLILDKVGVLALCSFQKLTSTISYSLDFQTSKQFKFTDSLLIIENIIQDKQNPFKLIVFTKIPKNKELNRSNSSYQLFEINLNEILANERPCDQNSDYEMFHPHDINQFHTQCYMGAKYSYFRKKTASNCYIKDVDQSPLELQTLINNRKVTPCECSDADYECDEGFQRADDESEICIPLEKSETERHKAEKECALGNFYYQRSGYRKIPGNLCQNGLHLDRDIQVQCVDALKDYTLRYLLMLLGLSTIYYVCYLTFWFYQTQNVEQQVLNRLKKKQPPIKRETNNKEEDKNSLIN